MSGNISIVQEVNVGQTVVHTEREYRRSNYGSKK